MTNTNQKTQKNYNITKTNLIGIDIWHADKERKKLHWTIINISVGIYVHHKKLHIKKKQNKQTTHLVIKSECK